MIATTRPMPSISLWRMRQLQATPRPPCQWPFERRHSPGARRPAVHAPVAHHLLPTVHATDSTRRGARGGEQFFARFSRGRWVRADGKKEPQRAQRTPRKKDREKTEGRKAQSPRAAAWGFFSLFFFLGVLCALCGSFRSGGHGR